MRISVDQLLRTIFELNVFVKVMHFNYTRRYFDPFLFKCNVERRIQVHFKVTGITTTLSAATIEGKQ